MNAPQFVPMPQVEWLRKSTLRFFERLDPSYKLPTTISLSSDTAYRLLRTLWEPLSRDVYYVSVVARRDLGETVGRAIYHEEELLQAESKIFHALNAAHEFFDGRISQAVSLLDRSGFGAGELAASATRVLQADLTSRTATRFLDLIKKADLYSGLNHRLWVSGEIGPPQWTDGEALAAKLNNERLARNTINALSRTITERFNVVRELVDRVVNERKAQSAKRKSVQVSPKPERVADIDGNRTAPASSARSKQQKKRQNDKRGPTNAASPPPTVQAVDGGEGTSGIAEGNGTPSAEPLTSLEDPPTGEPHGETPNDSDNPTVERATAEIADRPAEVPAA